MNYPELAPAFQLVRAGYDVWLGNQRGIKYSLDHKILDSTKDREYWEFSFTEMGKYDLPAQINFVRDHTGVDKLSYVGHSQGTSQMFYAISENQSYWEERINLFVALAPVTRIGNCKSKMVKFLSKFVGILFSTFNFL